MRCCNFFSAAFGGYNCIYGTKFSVIAGGRSNKMLNSCSSTVTLQSSAILGGYNNTICGGPCACVPENSVIINGYVNSIRGNNKVCNAVITSGANHIICGGCNVVIFSGDCANPFTVNSSNKTCVNWLAKGAGTFQIRHPEPSKYQTHVLQHSFVESPAADNIYRYRVTTLSCTATLTLPDYYKWLNEKTQVHIQPVDNYGKAFATIDENEKEITICSTEDGKFDLLVIGQRKDPSFKKVYEGPEFKK